MKHELSIFVLFLIAVVTVVTLKIESTDPAQADTAIEHDLSSSAGNTMPDTIQTLENIETENCQAKDSRAAYEAGYEDGRAAAAYDRAAHTPRASYDENSVFPTLRERARYAEGYKRGYNEAI